MSLDDYRGAGTAAIGAAILFPALWIYELGFAGWRDYQNFVAPEFGVADVLFLILGLLSIYVYYAFKQILHDHQNYSTLDVPISVMIGLLAFFHLGIFLLALGSSFLDASTAVWLPAMFWVVFVVLFGLVDLVIAVLLIRDHQQLPGLLMVFACMTLLLGVAELTVLFSLLAVVLLPLSLLVLAVHFLRKPDMIELV